MTANLKFILALRLVSHADIRDASARGPWSHTRLQVYRERRTVVRSRVRGAIIAPFLLALGSHPSARAQDYPARSITLIAPWAAGGAVDVVARIVAPKPSRSWNCSTPSLKPSWGCRTSSRRSTGLGWFRS
jgi:hypothetical protein